MKMIASCDFCKQQTDFQGSSVLRMVNLVDGYLNTNGATVSSRIGDVDAKKDLPKSIGNAVKSHLDRFNVFNEKILRIQIDMRDI